MAIEVQKVTGSVQNEFAQVIKDFSQCLFSQKQNGSSFLEISKESASIINNWGNSYENSCKNSGQIPEPFYFQGSDKANIFILDSTINFFKGKSGELLIKILGAMNLSTDSVFICNAVDLKTINKKIKTVSPKVIITIGTKAGQFLLKNRDPLEQLRGKFYEYQGVKVMPTFHPTQLLTKPELKRQVWEDMKKVMKYAGNQDGV